MVKSTLSWHLLQFRGLYNQAAAIIESGANPGSKGRDGQTLAVDYW